MIVLEPQDFLKIQEDLCRFLLRECCHDSGDYFDPWSELSIENSSLLSIGTEMTSSGPIVKNMGFLEKLYDTIEFTYMCNDDLNIY